MDKKKNREEIKETVISENEKVTDKAIKIESYKESGNKNMSENTSMSEKENKNKKEKNYTLAGILALFFGSIGLHKFYLGDWKMGILYALFMWTGIPGTIAFYEGAKYLMQ